MVAVLGIKFHVNSCCPENMLNSRMASGKAGFKQIQEIARPNAAKPHQPLSFVGFRLVSYVVDDGVCLFGRWPIRVELLVV